MQAEPEEMERESVLMEGSVRLLSLQRTCGDNRQIEKDGQTGNGRKVGND